MYDGVQWHQYFYNFIMPHYIHRSGKFYGTVADLENWGDSTGEFELSFQHYYEIKLMK